MADDDWDDSPSVEVSVPKANIDIGRDVIGTTAGRGFISQDTADHGWGDSESNGFGDRRGRGGREGDRGWRGGDRGGRGGDRRGRGGGRGGRDGDSWGDSGRRDDDSWGDKGGRDGDSYGSRSGRGGDSWGSRGGRDGDSWGDKGGRDGDSSGSRGGRGGDSWGDKGGRDGDSWGSRGGRDGDRYGGRGGRDGDRGRGRRDDDSYGGGRGGRDGGRNDDNNDWGSGGGGGEDRGRRGRGGGYRGRGRDDESGGGYRDRNNDESYGGGGGRNRNSNDDDEWGSGGGDSGRGRGGGRGGRGGGGRGDRGGEGGEGGDEKPRELYIPPEPTENENEMFEGVTAGINFAKYDHIKVKVTGENPVSAIETFEEAGFRKYVLENIGKSGYKKPTPIQKNAIPIIMQSRDLMACAQTGSGKTAAFLLPIINTILDDPRELTLQPCQPQAVIISPTRELTIQIFNEARKFAHGSILKICIAYGGTAVRHQGDKLSNGCHILVATPGRLLDFVDKERIAFGEVRFLVLDEADRMLDMGFMKDVEKMVEHPTMVPTGTRQTLMFSATFPESIQHLAGKFLHDYLFVAVGVVGGACDDVEQTFVQVEHFNKKHKLNDILEADGEEPPRTIVFVETKRNADFLASLLSQNNVRTTSIHGDRLQREREDAIRDFKSGRSRVLVATAVAARGLDIKNVDRVVNFDMPKSIDEYVHRIGRTGRVGNRGKAISFYDAAKDYALAGDLAKILKQANQDVPDFLHGRSSGSNSYQPGAKDIRKFDSGSGSSAPVQTGNAEPEEEW